MRGRVVLLLLALIALPSQGHAQGYSRACSAQATGAFGWVQVRLDFFEGGDPYEGSARWKSPESSDLTLEARFALAEGDERTLEPSILQFNQSIAWVPDRVSDIVLRLDTGQQYRQRFIDHAYLEWWGEQKADVVRGGGDVDDPAFERAFWDAGGLEVEIVTDDGVSKLKKHYPLLAAAGWAEIKAIDRRMREAAARRDYRGCSVQPFPAETSH